MRSNPFADPLKLSIVDPPVSIFTPPLDPQSDADTGEHYRRAIAYLFGRLNYERAPDAARSMTDFKLDRMQDLLTGLGQPQLSVPTVHVAGSKGKGSTATMIARIVEAAGYRVGLFTSPHVARFEERFTINGSSPSQQAVISLFEQVRPLAEQLDQRFSGYGPTFFDLTTAMAWLYFAQQEVDMAVMEVGLGGRLDSTNVCSPLLTVITSISRDHTRLLGDTVELIAREKAGIIKPGVPVVTGATDAGPAEVIEEVAQSVSAPVHQLGVEFCGSPLPIGEPPFTEPRCFRFDYLSQDIELPGLELAMPGEHQMRNAALAIRAALLLREEDFELSDEAIRSGLLAAHCPLRVEVVGREPLLIIDAAHNPASIEALCQTLRGVAARRRVAIFASSRDKETSRLLALLNCHFDEILLTRYVNNPRAVELPALEELARECLTIKWRTVESPTEALAIARRESQPNDLICVTGSFFLAAEVQELLASSQP